MNKEKRTNEFLEKQGKGFHLRLLQYLRMELNEQGIKEVQDPEKVLFFTFPGGKYSIRYKDLLDRASDELSNLEIFNQ